MKNKLTYLILATVFTLLIPLTATACRKSDNVVRINEVTHSVFYAPLYLAEALGYFEEEGIQIELTNGGGADKTMAAVLAGEADIGFCGPEAVIYTYIGGSGDAPKVFGQLTDRDGSFLVGRTKEENFDWKNLEGKDIIAGRPGGVPFMTFDYVLKSMGVTANYRTDIDFNLTVAAFEGGTGEYCTMFEPTASEYEKAGKGYVVGSVGEQAGNIPYTCFMAKSSYINEHGDTVEGLLRAITKAVKYVYETDPDIVAGYLTDYFASTSKESIKTSLESYIKIDTWVKNMAMQESGFNRLQDIIEAAGELKKRVAFNDIVLTDTAQKVYNQVYAK